MPEATTPSVTDYRTEVAPIGMPVITIISNLGRLTAATKKTLESKMARQQQPCEKVL